MYLCAFKVMVKSEYSRREGHLVACATAPWCPCETLDVRVKCLMSSHGFIRGFVGTQSCMCLRISAWVAKICVRFGGFPRHLFGDTFPDCHMAIHIAVHIVTLID